MQAEFVPFLSDLTTLENNSVDKAEFSFSHQVLMPSGLLVVPNCALKKKKKKKKKKEECISYGLYNSLYHTKCIQQ